MTFRTLLLIKAVVCLVFGLFLLLAPGVLLDLLGATLSDGGTFTAREYGAAMAGTLMLTWFARNTKATDARWAILLDLLIYDLIGAIVTMAAVLSGVLNVLGWAIFLVYLFFTAGSGYLLMKEKSAQQVPSKA
jgi:hypothetical protein